MKRSALAVLATGAVTSVGLTAAATCAALRAQVANPTLTGFTDTTGQLIMGHQVSLERPWRGRDKLVRMAGLAAGEALLALAGPDEAAQALPVLLCVAEAGHSGCIPTEAELDALESFLGLLRSPYSQVIAKGQIGVAVALAQARGLIDGGCAHRVLVVATDSLLTGGTLEWHSRQRRLLTEKNANGFMPGEGAGAIVVAPDSGGDARVLRCLGLGFGTERASVESEDPLRGDGLLTAIRAALADAGGGIDDLACRITDLAGEQYHFKEATLALSRTLRQQRENLALWHPAECIGHVGAASGAICIAVADAAARKHYMPPGRSVLLHFSNDDRERGAIVLGVGG